MKKSAPFQGCLFEVRSVICGPERAEGENDRTFKYYIGLYYAEARNAIYFQTVIRTIIGSGPLSVSILPFVHDSLDLFSPRGRLCVKFRTYVSIS